MDLKKEKLLKKAYVKLLEVGFGDGTIEDMPEFVVKDVMGYGTALDEKILSINELIELMQNQRNQVENFDDFRYTSNPVITRMSDGGNTALIVDEIELLTVIENKSNLMHLRMSTLLEFLDETWKIIHWHGSTAEHVSEGEDPWHVNEWKQKTEKLEKLVEEKTVDLKHKNRELEIESSLERVRTAAMGMRKPEEMLDVCQVISKQLEMLGITNIRNVQTAIIKDKQRVYLNYQYYTAYDEVVFEEIETSKHSKTIEMVEEIKKSEDAIFTGVLKGEELADFREYRKKDGQFADPLADETDSLHYYFYSIGQGALGLSTFKPISNYQLEIFERFHNVFKLAYRRFVDIEKAEAQAREAQIEAALERVRSKTNAMQRSEQLSETATVMFQQLCSLGQVPDRLGIVIYNEQQQIFENWITDQSGMQLTKAFNASNKEPTTFSKVYKAWKENKDLIIIDLTGQELKNWIRFVKKNMKIHVNESNIKNRRIHYAAFFSHGSLMCTFHKPSEHNFNQLFVRFAKVFDQTYTRFLDLKKAEAQAREAQIEAALERVRSRSLAMQKSDELKEIIQLIHDQLIHLNFEIDAAGFTLDYFQNNDWNIWIANKYESLPSQIYVPYIDHPQFNYYKTAKEKGVDFFANTLSFEDKNSIFTYMFEFMGDYSQAEKDELLSKPGLAISQAFLKNITLWIYNLEGTPYAEEDNNTLMRFAGVFEQTYVRFNDLKQAEIQAREAEIELALERVRARAMAMHKSEELAELSLELVKQVQALGTETWFCAFNIYHDDPKGSLEWGSNGQGTFPKYRTPREGVFLRYFEAGQRGEELLVNEIDESECPAHYDYLCSLPGVGEQLLKMKDAGVPFPSSQIDHVAYFKYGYILFITFEPAAEAHDIFKRFAKVFEQTYTRFLDLQKAEAQAKEAQIEAALEKVRSHTMGMHSSEELANVATVMFDQLRILGGDLFSCGIVLCDIDKNEVEQWHSLPEAGMLPPFYVPVDLDYIHQYRYDQWKAGVELFSIEIPEDKIARHFELMETIPSLKEFMGAVAEKGIKMPEWPDWEIDYGASFRYGYILASALKPFENKEILPRFANVFEQTYTRFLDLKKAESQAREAQIESALERVRSKTMAMHNSQDVGATVVTLFEEVLKLGIDKSSRIGIGILEGYEGMETRSANSLPNGKVDLKMGMLDMTIHPMLVGLKKAWKRGEPGYSYDYIGKDVYTYYHALSQEPEYPFKIDLDALPENEYHNSFFFKEGILFFFAPNPISNEASNVLTRFAQVFGQTYRRYLDLQKAEAQAREAQIEAALERVRARSMAMQKSEELAETAAHLFKQFTHLGIHTYRCNIAIVDSENDLAQLWSTTNSGEVIPISTQIPLVEYPVFKTMHKSWKSKEKRSIIKLSGKDRLNWTNYIMKYVSFEEYTPERIDIKKVSNEMAVFTNFFFHQGFFVIHTTNDISEPDMNIIQRFAKVFEQTFTRFQDLQKAEYQANEAIKQASLDRVRGQIASMRSTDDLQRITPLIWRELETLEVPFNRCGVFIIDEMVSQVRVYLTTPDGKPLGVLKLPFDANDLTRNAIEHWRNKTVYAIHWNKNDFINWVQSMVKLGQIQNIKQYQGNVAPPETLDLHFIPFGQGMLYVGNNEPLSEEKIDLVKSLAKSFSVAYARYEDFKQLEVAKNKIEITLNDLKSTQTQLIQAEKMASLGELTAGIAHEIQNPLNFVNNFSEVSSELMDEMNEELDNGDVEEALEIASAIKQNLEKINHHGKRADIIVKGMLQHSQSSKGIKEPTDINILADEYLRLAYHGLRAKDKSFNADFKMDLDDDLPKINVVPQDIGRVLLNLINNAFYACTERRQNEISETSVNEGFNYKPLVAVTTKKMNNKVKISVKDNGNGIPKHILDKIFQPFFTTKPTGQGTGLGLSLSYDIVNAHGGQINIHSLVNKGTEFIISLPFNQ